MKRNCNGCRALDDGRCSLGYKIGANRHFNYVVTEYKPLEECPKPKTYNEYFRVEKKK